MSRIALNRAYDIANLHLGDFAFGTVTATSTSITYRLGSEALVIYGAFVLSGGLPVSGTISGLTHSDGGLRNVTLSALGWGFDQFETAMSNDDLRGLLAGGDTVTGTGAAETLRGYEGNDALYGGAGNDRLFGYQGNDTLDGGGGNDSMVGGSGDDVYIVNSQYDRVFEVAGGGIDRVQTALSSHTLANEVENLTYVGGSNFTGIGNGSDNVIIGGRGNDTLSGYGGDDTIRGGNGHDVINGNAGDDWLIGDAGASFVTTTVSAPSPQDPAEPITLSMTLPEVTAGNSTTVSGYVNNSTLDGGTFNLAFVLDVSGSMADAFSGATVGDRNGDGVANTNLDAAIASFEALVASINAAGLGDNVRIALIPFDSYSEVSTVGTGTSDTNGDGVADVIEAARDLLASGGTNYANPLGNAVDFFNTTPEGNNFVFFLSDGQPDGTPYASYLNQLRDPDGINATIRALGISAGAGSYYDVLDALDDGRANDSAIDVVDPADLTAGLLNSQVNLADVAGLQIWRNGTLLTTLSAAQLTQTPFGLQYSYTIPGLSSGGTNQIEARLLLNDGASSYISTVQTVSVGALVSNDRLYGGAGDDTLDGGAGVDTLQGGTGNDIYRVDSGGDVIVEAANAGTDGIESTVSFSLSAASGANIENLSLMGSRNISGTGNALANVIQGNIGNNVIQGIGGGDTLIGGFGVDTVSYTAATQGVSVDLSSGSGLLNGRTDVLSGFENIWGSNYGDDLTGDGGDNVIIGRGGNDTIDGGAGFDTVSFASATSAVTVALNQSYYGGTSSSGNGAEGSDALDDIEAIIGSGYGDRISDGNYSRSLNNLFDGGAGNDLLQGGFGSDTLIGGAGNDTMDGGVNYSSSYVDIDVADYSGAGAAIRGNIAGTIQGNATGTDTLSNFEWIIGTNYGDSLVGSVADETFEGGGGNDTLRGGDGADVLIGGAGANRLFGGAGNDTYVVTSAADVLSELAGEGTDLVQSSVSFALSDVDIENLTLTGLNNISGSGNAGANAITGNSVNNLLRGYAGADTILGGDGDDNILGGNGSDSLVGGNGTDRLNFSDNASGVSGTLDNYSTATFTSANGTDTVSGFEDIVGSAYADSLGGNSGNNLIYGGGGNDTISGGYGDDTLYGNGGNDVIDGGYGRDMISYAHLTTGGVNVNLATGVITGEGNDTILNNSIEIVEGTAVGDIIGWNSGSTSTYTDFELIGGGGSDTLRGSAGDDTLNGGTGADTMIGGAGNDVYYVDTASDVVTEESSSGYDRIISEVSLTLRDNVEHLTLVGTATSGFGNDLNNEMTGNDRDNVLRAGQGSDTLIGGLGQDTLDGGLDTGYDAFVFNSVEDSRAGAYDRIENFNEAYDRIVLTNIDADTLNTGNQAFSFIGTDGFNGAAGELRYQVYAGGTLISGDVDGDRVADFAVLLAGSHILTSADFYL
ncbi:beta strand repeat-containing protein [Phaeovulum sp. W22_SRMD_FR3]|uniref:beta strand repeat-containing protein n=1 Tax=Phaeovulum sp. W22_SRMD_FR3 TaxID=3240274 RepID=UPI003F9E9115